MGIYIYIYIYIYILYISIQCSKHAHEVQCNTYGSFSKICEYNYSVPLLSSEMIPWNKRIWKRIWLQLHQEVALYNKLVNMAKIELFYTFVKILVYLWLKSTRNTNLKRAATNMTETLKSNRVCCTKIKRDNLKVTLFSYKDIIYQLFGT